MRTLPLIVASLLIAGCATNKPAPEDYLTRVGSIVGKEVIEPEGGSTQRRTNTSVSASVSSGGGVSVGIGVLLGSFSRGSGKPTVGYRVQLPEDETITVYHDSDVFEVGDCVEIRSLPDNDQEPPLMKRLPEGCE